MDQGPPRREGDSWISSLHGWLFPQGGGAPARLAASAAPPTAAHAAQAERPSSTAAPQHAVVMVHGLFGLRANWDHIRSLLATHLDPETTLLFVSTANERHRTFEGVDACGRRLAEEIRGLAAAHPSLTRVSVLAHSMGGLMWVGSRYALGQLFDPASGTVAGLQPSHFVALASPHLGCDGVRSPAQVPLIGWAEALPLGIGGAVQKVMQGYFLSALAAFETRTLFANSSGDHLKEGPGRGVIREDPLEAAWWPEAARRVHTAPAAAGLHSHQSRQLSEQDILESDTPQELAAHDSSNADSSAGGTAGDGAGLRGSGPAAHDGRAGNGAGDGASGRPCGSGGGGARVVDVSVAAGALAAAPTADMRGHPPAIAAAAEGARSAVTHHPADVALPSASSGDGGTMTASAIVPAAAAGAGAAAAADLEAAVPELPLPLRLPAKLFSVEPQAFDRQLAAERLAHAEQASGGWRILERLQALPWRRVDVCFGATALSILSHQHIQVQRWWLNGVGEPVARHLVLQLQAMEQLRAEVEAGAAGR
eukprot:scaffold29.g5958.t1